MPWQNPTLLLFFHIVKTGGTTFKFILANNLGLSFCDAMKAKPQLFSRKELEFAQQVFPSLSGFGGHNVCLKSAYPEDQVFAVVFLRDPLSRTLSDFQHYCQVYLDEDTIEEYLGQFPTWVQEHGNAQTKKLATSGTVDDAKRVLREEFDLVGLVEKFDESIQMAQSAFPRIQDLRYVRKRVSGESVMRETLLNTERYRRMLEEATAKDAELYRFVKEEIFPEQRKRWPVDSSTSYDVLHSANTPRFLLSKWYNKAVYRSLVKLRTAMRQ